MIRLVKIFKIVLVFIGITETLFAYNWPVKDFDKQHPIYGTLGEYRTADRFHKGVDIGAADGTPVYAIYGGEIEWGGSKQLQHVKIGDMFYVHLT